MYTQDLKSITINADRMNCEVEFNGTNAVALIKTFDVVTKDELLNRVGQFVANLELRDLEKDKLQLGVFTLPIEVGLTPEETAMVEKYKTNSKLDEALRDVERGIITQVEYDILLASVKQVANK